MPTYPFSCPNGHSMERMLKMDDRDSPQECHCGEIMQRIFTPPLAVIWQGRWHDQWRDKPGGEDDGLGPMAE